MKQIKLSIIAVLLVCALAIAMAFAGAEASRAADYRGTWVADGVAAEIWREDDALRCRAVFWDGGEESEIWEYSICLYDEAGEALQCLGVARTHERFDSVLDEIVELDWSTDDMSLAELRLSEDGLLFADEKLDEPILLVQLNRAESSPRNEALAFAGLWRGDACALRAEDHGACWRFTVTRSVNSAASRRWTHTCVYDPDSGRMTSANVSPCTVITREADGGVTETEEDIDAGDCECTLENGDRLIWRDVTGGAEIALTRLTD